MYPDLWTWVCAHSCLCTFMFIHTARGSQIPWMLPIKVFLTKWWHHWTSVSLVTQLRSFASSSVLPALTFYIYALCLSSQKPWRHTHTHYRAEFVESSRKSFCNYNSHFNPQWNRFTYLMCSHKISGSYKLRCPILYSTSNQCNLQVTNKMLTVHSFLLHPE